MRARGALREDALALHLESLYLPFAIGSNCSLRRPINGWNSSLRLLFFHGFALPSTRHALILIVRR